MRMQLSVSEFNDNMTVSDDGRVNYVILSVFYRSVLEDTTICSKSSRFCDLVFTDFAERNTFLVLLLECLFILE